MIKVLLNNKTGKAFDRKALCAMKKAICYTIETEHPDIEGEVSLTVCDNEYIRELNSEFRGIDAPTDVLSFPTLDFDMGGYTIIGDIIISLERATAQAEEALEKFLESYENN